MADFDKAVEVLLRHEGLFVDTPEDRGGPTKFGITLKTLTAYLGYRPDVDYLKDLSVDTAKKIYKKMFWDYLDLGGIDSQVIATVIFDQVVLSGPVSAMRNVFKAAIMPIPLISIKVGPVLATKLNSSSAPLFCARFVCLQQDLFISICQRVPTQMKFLSGWMNRTHELLMLALGDK